VEQRNTKVTKELRPAFVYLLIHATEGRFKIGKAVDPIQRARIGASGHSRTFEAPFNMKNSLQLRCESAAIANGLEKTLHHVFRNSRVDVPIGDGYTEWFSLDVLPNVIRYLDQQHAVLGASAPEALTVPQPSIRRRGPRRIDLEAEARMGQGMWRNVLGALFGVDASDCTFEFVDRTKEEIQREQDPDSRVLQLSRRAYKHRRPFCVSVPGSDALAPHAAAPQPERSDLTGNDTTAR